MSRKPRKVIRTYDQTLTPILDDDVLGTTDDVYNDVESSAHFLSTSQAESSNQDKHPAIIVSSKKVSISQIPETHRQSVIISFKGTETQESSEGVLVIEHKALVSGYCDFIDPKKIIPELCPTVYEMYVEDLETGLMIRDRVCEVIMITESFGLVHNSPTNDVDFVVAGDSEVEEPLKRKFEKKKSTKLGKVGGPKQTGGPGQGVTEGVGTSTAKEKLDPNVSDILLVGDSIAAGMLGAAAEMKYTKAPKCLNKNGTSVWYWNCEGEHAVLSGTTTSQIFQMLKRALNSAQKTTKKKVMIVSAGTNDALANAGIARSARVTSFTPEIAIANIDKIINLGTSKGYIVRIMLINPLYVAKMKSPDDQKIGWYNEFAKKVNAHLKKYDTFHYGVQSQQVEMSDYIHPSKSGSKQLLKKALSL